MQDGKRNIGTEEDPAVTRLREYLRIRTVHPDPDYSKLTN